VKNIFSPKYRRSFHRDHFTSLHVWYSESHVSTSCYPPPVLTKTSKIGVLQPVVTVSGGQLCKNMQVLAINQLNAHNLLL